MYLHVIALFQIFIKYQLFTQTQNWSVQKLNNLQTANQIGLKVKFAYGRKEKMGKGENTGCQHLLLFTQYFQKPPSGFLNSG